MSVLGVVDLLGVGTENVDTRLLQPKSNVLGQLTSDGDDNSLGSLHLVNVHDSLPAELLEVESVSLVEVGRDSLGVVVDHDGLLAQVSDSSRAGDGTPVELDGGTDSVDTRTENHGSVLVKLDVVSSGVVGGVEVVGVGGELGSESVDSLDEGSNAEGLSERSDLER